MSSLRQEHHFLWLSRDEAVFIDIMHGLYGILYGMP